jgi:hypothetical protein
VRIAERGWTFEPEGRARSVDSVAFLGNDFSDERWRTRVTTLVPAAAGLAAFLEAGIEEGLRSKDVLVSSQSYSYGRPLVENPALRLPRTYLSRAILRLLPRMVKDLGAPRRMAFTMFDHTRADLVMRIVEIKGAADLPTGAAGTNAFRIDEREGLAAEPSSLYVDATGRLLHAQSGKTTMTPASKEEMERIFGRRVAEADRQISQLEQAYAKDEERFRRGSGP